MRNFGMVCEGKDINFILEYKKLYEVLAKN